LQREDLEWHLSQLREDIGGRQRRRRSNRGRKGGRQRTTVGIGQVLDLGEPHAFLACVLRMRDRCQSSLVQPWSQGCGVDAEQGTDVRKRKKIQSNVLLSGDQSEKR